MWGAKKKKQKTSFLLTPVTSSQVPKWLKTKTFHQNQNLSGVYIHYGIYLKIYS